MTTGRINQVAFLFDTDAAWNAGGVQDSTRTSAARSVERLFSGQMEADGLVPTECSASERIERPPGACGNGARTGASARCPVRDGRFSVRLSQHSRRDEPREVEFNVFRQASAIERMQHRKPTTGEADRARTDK